MAVFPHHLAEMLGIIGLERATQPASQRGHSAFLTRTESGIESGSWINPSDLKRTFASASFAGALTIFHVGGNKYRIAAFVHYGKQIVYVKKIGTHKEYGKWDL